MKKAVLCLSLLVSLCLGLNAHAVAKPTKVEILYMNHGPLEETLNKVKAVFSGYGGKLTVSWYDFERRGSSSWPKRGKTAYSLCIWIDDSPVVVGGLGSVRVFQLVRPRLFQGKCTVTT
jgi:hypothetical protein